MPDQNDSDERPSDAADEAGDEAEKSAKDVSGVDPQGSITLDDPSNAEFHDRATDESSH